MLFKDTLNNLKPEVDTAVTELFNAVQSNQTHEQDLLLTHINGSYEESLKEYKEKLSPFVFGPGGWIYNADETQYRFYDAYRHTIEEIPRDVYFEDFDSNLKKQFDYDFLLQIELMVFLKFWESEPMLKRLYQLSNLAQGKNYDWYFNMASSGKPHKIIRTLVRDPIKDICPKYYKLLKDIYLSQIRNAAAHSQFYILHKKIGFCNYNKKHSPLTQIDFSDWEQRFHKLILLYNAILYHLNETHKEYVARQVDKEFGLEVRLTATKSSWIKWVEAGRVDWMWYDTWKKHYKNK
jgi:hypothetical protein